MQNIILFTVVFEFDLVCIGGHSQLIGGVIQVELDFFTDFGEQVQLNILVKVELQSSALLHRKQVIVCLRVFYTQLQAHGS